MLLKACNRCGNLIPYGRAYCEACTPIIEGERSARLEAARKEGNRRYNKKRGGTRYAEFYRGKDWRRLSRERIRADGYKCVKCGAMASEVDHIIPIQTPEGWDRRYDWNNLQSLCIQCHNEKHKRFNRRSGSGPAGPRPISS